MSVDLYDYAPPNSVAFVLAHLLPLAGDPAGLGWKRWEPGMTLPYRMVQRVTGADDQITDYPVMSIQTFAATDTSAVREADRTHQRMLLLANLDDIIDVTLPDGTVANCEYFDVLEGPRYEPYNADNATRLVSRYQLGLHFTPTP